MVLKTGRLAEDIEIVMDGHSWVTERKHGC
jgi:hypothetical protein